ncbi:colipase isoform X2 [Falco peregrinus]|uniref:colipase isoform X2 n=1 Tax=Falco peregrinus TaxID=8954 RepID=UPI0024786772|nr:colipase isoform X2 [Falco peregrinus]
MGPMLPGCASGMGPVPPGHTPGVHPVSPGCTSGMDPLSPECAPGMHPCCQQCPARRVSRGPPAPWLPTARVKERREEGKAQEHHRFVFASAEGAAKGQVDIAGAGRTGPGRHPPARGRDTSEPTVAMALPPRLLLALLLLAPALPAPHKRGLIFNLDTGELCLQSAQCKSGCCHRTGGLSLARCAPKAAEFQECSPKSLYGVYYKCPCESGLTCDTDRTIVGSITNSDFGTCKDPRAFYQLW